MNKILFGLGATVLGVAMIAGSVDAFPIYQAPNGGNSDFYPLMQHQLEKQETLDFVNDSENYKKKRDKKNVKNKINESNFNPNYAPNYGATYTNSVQPVQMQFTQGADGSIKIQGIQSNPEINVNNNK